MRTEARKFTIALVGYKRALTPLTKALNFFKVPFELNPTNLKGFTLTLYYHRYAHILRKNYGPILCIPSNTTDFHRLIKALNVRVKHTKQWLQLNLKVRNGATIRFSVSDLFHFTGPVEAMAYSRRNPIIVRVRGTNTYLLTVDLVKEMEEFEGRLDLKPCFLFKAYSWLPINLISRSIGNKVQGLVARCNTSLDKYLSHMSHLDGLRYLLVAAVTISSQKPVKTLGFWVRGAKYAAVVTHDVDTKLGFEEGIGLLRSVERKYGVRSSWNIPIKRYRIQPKIIKGLVSEGCEIGSHGYRHDGRLIFASENELAERFRESKQLLTKVSGSQVKGFRAPLLQHSRGIVHAVQKTGFLYDSSIPSWEVYSRTDGKSHGIGTVYPFMISEHLVELVVTLPQDYQLLYLGCLSPTETLKLWKTLKEYIKSLGGLCNVIIHPDEDLFGRRNMVSYYEEFIEDVAGDLECWVTLPSEVAEWWALRNRMEVTPEGRYALLPREKFGARFDEIELIEYKPDDFVFE